MILIVQVVHAVIFFVHRVLLLIIVHHLTVDSVVNLETLCLDLLFPVIVVDLHVVEDCVHQNSDIWILIGKKFKYDGHHLGLVEYDFPRWSEEEELEESVQDLLDHFIVFLFGSKQVLQQFDKIRGCDDLSNLIISTDRANKHHAFQNDIIFCISVHQVIVEELNHIPLFNLFLPFVSWHVNHCSKKFEKKVSVVIRLLSKFNVSVHVFFKKVE